MPANPAGSSAQELVAAGLTALKLGDQHSARDCFAQALAADSQHYAALYWMSYFARRRADALDYLRRSLARSRQLRGGQRELIRQRVWELSRGGDPAATPSQLEQRARAWEAAGEQTTAIPQTWMLGGALAAVLVLVLGAWIVLARSGTPPAAESGGGIVIITPTATPLPAGAAPPTETQEPSAANPTPTPPPEPTPTPVVYVVQPGDTLFGIALSFGLSVEDLQEANDISDPGTLQVGQELIIPPTSTP